MAEPTPQQELVALMFTDIVDSVALQSRLGTAGYTRFIHRHDEIFKSALDPAKGANILNETGDGFLVSFGTATEAVNTALRLQHAAEGESVDGAALRVRIGLHLGEVTQMDEQVRGEKRAVGMAINLASRVMDLAEGGQILMTRPIFDDARQFVRHHPDAEGRPGDAEELTLQWPAHGRYLFKGHDEPLEIYEVGALEFSPLSPPEGSDKAKRAVAADEEDTLGWRPGAGLPIPRREDWVIEEKVGVGGFGEVWVARHINSKEERVFKFCFDPERLRSFRRELTLFRLLRDALGKRDDIAALHDVSIEMPPFYLESEYLPTGNLRKWSDSLGGIGEVPMGTRIDLAARTARAVDAAHSVGIVHKDIKPSNILIALEGGEPRPRLSDFGIGTLADASALDDLGITQMGFTQSLVFDNDSTRSMTQLYAPPEYLVGGSASTKGDIYSLGVMLYQLAAGDLNRPLASGWQRDIDDDLLCEEIERCVDVDPDRRFDTAGELAERLGSLAARRAQREEHRRMEQLRAQANRRRRFLVLAALSCAALVMLSAVLGSGYLKQKRLTEEQMRLTEEANELRANARKMAGQSDFLLAGQLLQRDRRAESIAYLARSLRNNPSDRVALSKLYSTLSLSNFVAPVHPPLLGGEPDTTSRFYATPDREGDRVLALDAERRLTLFDLATSQALLEPFDHRGERVREAKFLDAGRKVIAVTADDGEMLDKMPHRIRLWDAESGRQLRQEPQGDTELWHLNMTRDGSFWVAAEMSARVDGALPTDFKIQLWDLRGAEWEIHTFERPPGGRLVHFIEPTSDGNTLVAITTQALDGRSPRIASTLDLTAGPAARWQELDTTLKAWTGPPMKAALSPDGRWFATPEPDGNTKIYDLAEGRLAHQFAKPEDYVLALRMSPDSRLLGIGYFGSGAIIWNLETGKSTSQPLLHEAGVIDLAISADSTRVLTCSMDQSSRVWDLQTGRALTESMRQQGYVITGDFVANDTRAFTFSMAGKAFVWGLAGTGARGTPIPNVNTGVAAVAPDWNHVASIEDGRVRVRSLPDGKLLNEIEVDGGQPASVHFLDDGGRALITRGTGQVVIHDLDTGTHEQSQIAHDGIMGLRATTPDGASLLTTDKSGQFEPTSLRLWRRDQDGDYPPAQELKHESEIRNADIDRAGRRATCASDRNLYLWELPEAPDAPVTPRMIPNVSFPLSHDLAEDGQTLLVGSAEGALRLWDFTNATPLTKLLEMPGPVVAVALSPDGRFGAGLSVTLNKVGHVAAAQVWDLESEEPLTLPMKLPGISNAQALSWTGRQPSIRFSPGRDRILVDIPGQTAIWEISPDYGGEAPAWVPEVAEAIGGWRLDAQGKLARVDYGSLHDLRGRLDGFSGHPALIRWTDWLLQDRATRPISPGSHCMLEDCVASLLETGTETNVREALIISPMNPVALAVRAEQLVTGSQQQPTLAAWYAESAAASLGVPLFAEPRQPGHHLPPPSAQPDPKHSAGSDHHHPDPSEQRSLGLKALSRARLKLGDLDSEGSSPQLAQHSYAQAVRSITPVIEQHPEDSEARRELAGGYLRLGDVSGELGEHRAAADYYQLAILLLYLADGTDGSGSGEALSTTALRLAGARAAQAGSPIPTSAILRGSEWRFADSGAVPDPDWRELAFEASSWQSGPAPFGYGDGREATKLDEGEPGGGRPITAYFRHEFTIEELDGVLDPLVRFQRDDGLVLYLNGTEFHRSNLPPGELSPQTQALSSISDAFESRWHAVRPDPTLFRHGKNVIAAELHQSNATSSDAHFELELLPDASAVERAIAELDEASLDSLASRLGPDLPEGLRKRLTFLVSGEPGADPAEPKGWVAWTQRASILHLRGEHDAATTAIGHALGLAITADLDPSQLSTIRHKKVELLRAAGQHQKAQAEYLKLKEIPARPSSLGAEQLDLSPFYNASTNESWLTDPELPTGGFRDWNSLGGLPTGAVELGGILFDIRGIIQLDSPAIRRQPDRKFPSSLSGIPVGQTSEALHFLHACAYGKMIPTGEPVSIGSYLIHYEDGQTTEIPVRLGKDLSDWHLEPGEREANQVAGPDGFNIAWEGSNLSTDRRGASLALYRTTWKNPRPEQAIRSLDFRSAGQSPAPFLIAVTSDPP